MGTTRHDQSEDWTLAVYDPWDSEEAPQPQARRHRWAIGVAIAALLAMAGLASRDHAPLDPDGYAGETIAIATLVAPVKPAAPGE